MILCKWIIRACQLDETQRFGEILTKYYHKLQFKKYVIIHVKIVNVEIGPK